MHVSHVISGCIVLLGHSLVHMPFPEQKQYTLRARRLALDLQNGLMQTVLRGISSMHGALRLDVDAVLR